VLQLRFVRFMNIDSFVALYLKLDSFAASSYPGRSYKNLDLASELPLIHRVVRT
jgi:hypothetical protein